MKRLRDIGTTHFMFHQDDTFSNDNELIAWEDLLYIIKSHKKNFLLSLRFSSAFFEDRKPTIQTPTLNFYQGTMADWIDNGFWPMEDQPYICSIDMLEKLYDKAYFSYPHIWDMELHLQREWRKKPETPRHFTNKSLFTNFNIVGSSLDREWAFRARLVDKGLLDPIPDDAPLCKCHFNPELMNYLNRCRKCGRKL